MRRLGFHTDIVNGINFVVVVDGGGEIGFDIIGVDVGGNREGSSERLNQLNLECVDPE